ncbi:MAG: hypothetical protein P8Y36_11290, partial [Alphaproteobacteria bacterium]
GAHCRSIRPINRRVKGWTVWAARRERRADRADRHQGSGRTGNQLEISLISPMSTQTGACSTGSRRYPV